MRFTESLKKNSEFRRVYAKGKSSAGPLVVLYCRKNGTGMNRLGITVGSKVGKAVRRNLIRRRIREIYRLAEDGFQRGYDIVAVARVRAASADYRALHDDLIRCAKRVGLLTAEEMNR
ncbi:MAG: ribonuclease P protein component [Clostridiales bacterium]|nr:ribonuclease P protein component [Clostridiales bacterium]